MFVWAGNHLLLVGNSDPPKGVCRGLQSSATTTRTKIDARECVSFSPLATSDSFGRPMLTHKCVFAGATSTRFGGKKVTPKITVAGSCNHLLEVRAQKMTRKAVFASTPGQLEQVGAQKIIGRNLFSAAHDRFELAKEQKVTVKNGFAKPRPLLAGPGTSVKRRIVDAGACHHCQRVEMQKVTHNNTFTRVRDHFHQV